MASGTFYASYLSPRKVLYDVRYCSLQPLLECEYTVLDLASVGDYENYASEGENGLENLMALLKSQGYKEYKTLENVLGIYYRQDSP